MANRAPQQAELAEFSPGLEIRGIGGSLVGGTSDLYQIGDMRIATLTSTPVHVRWHPERNPGAPEINVLFQVSGSGMCSQDERRDRLHPGDFCFFDGARPFEIRTDDNIRQHAIGFPSALVREHLSRISGLTAVRIDGAHGTGRFLRTFVETLITDRNPGDLRVGTRLRDHAVELLLTAIYEHCAPPDSSRMARDAQLRRARGYILDRLHDPDLDVEGIAAGLNMSVRYLYSLFEAEGVSVARWVRERRLSRCRRTLEDSHSASLSICAIALQNGFNDSAYFSTVFRAAYDMTPSDCRRAAQSPAGAPRR